MQATVIITRSFANIPLQRCRTFQKRSIIKCAENIAIATLASLLFASSAGAVRDPTDHDVVDYLSFVAYMGPTAHNCWTYNNLQRPNVYPGIMFARLRKDTSIFHGTVNGSWAKNSKISANSFYGTNQWYPVLHVFGKSYFTGGVMSKNYKKKPQPLNDPRILEYKVMNTKDLYLYAYDLFPERFVKRWIQTKRAQSKFTETFYHEQLKIPKMKPNIAGVKTISKYWNTQFKIPIQGFIQRRAVQGSDFKTLAKGVVGRMKGQPDGNLNGIDGKSYFVNASETFNKLFNNDWILHYDEVVYFDTPAYYGSFSLDNPSNNQDAIRNHVTYWLKACDTPTNVIPAFPYMLNYMTYWPWNNNSQLFQGRDQKNAVEELQGLNLHDLRSWNKKLLNKLHEDLIKVAKKKTVEPIFHQYYVLASHSNSDLMTSADVAQIRFLAFDLLVKYCRRGNMKNYHVCTKREVKTSPGISKIRVKRNKKTNKINEVDIQPNGALNQWLF